MKPITIPIKNKIVNDLVNLGYETGVILKIVSEFDFSNDLEIAKKERSKGFLGLCFFIL